MINDGVLYVQLTIFQQKRQSEISSRVLLTIYTPKKLKVFSVKSLTVVARKRNLK